MQDWKVFCFVCLLCICFCVIWQRFIKCPGSSFQQAFLLEHFIQSQEYCFQYQKTLKKRFKLALDSIYDHSDIVLLVKSFIISLKTYIYIKHVSVKSVNNYCRQLTANPLIRELIIILGTVTFSSKINMDISFWILKCIICELKNQVFQNLIIKLNIKQCYYRLT